MTDEAWKNGAFRSAATRWPRIIGLTILGVAGTAVFAFAFGYFVTLLWNWLMPSIFGLGTITYWQAFGIMILARLLFGGIGFPGAHRPGHERPRSRGFGAHASWQRFWNQEGREAFRRYMERMRNPEAGAAEDSPSEASPEHPSEG